MDDFLDDFLVPIAAADVSGRGDPIADLDDETGEAPVRWLCGGDSDMPGLLAEELPPHIQVKPQFVGAEWRLGCAVDLKALSLQLRMGTCNPRTRDPQLLIRVVEPAPLTAVVRSCGSVSIKKARADVDTLKAAARKIVRMVQKVGYPDARCLDFRTCRCSVTAELCHPVRLEGVARKWSRHVMYDPDVTSSLFFYLASPRVTLAVTSGGRVTVHGVGHVEEGREAIARTYLLFKEFSA